jgi:hypothetical protein
MTDAALTAIQVTAGGDILILGAGKGSCPTHQEHNDANDEVTHCYYLPFQ